MDADINTVRAYRSLILEELGRQHKVANGGRAIQGESGRGSGQFMQIFWTELDGIFNLSQVEGSIEGSLRKVKDC